MVSEARRLAVEKVAGLVGDPRDLVSFWRAAPEVVAPVLSHWWTPCFFTLDPASMLVTSHFHEGLDEFPAEALAAEYYGDDVHQLVDVVRSQDGISTLHEVTGGDPTSSPRWQFNRTMGGDQELIARLRTGQGQTWGAVSFYREPGAPMFDAQDKAFVQALSPHLARGARTALLIGSATDPDVPDAPGLLMLDDRLEMISATVDVARWLDELPDGDRSRGRLPSSVLAVAASALGPTGTGDSGGFARVLSRKGNWVLLHGARLEGGTSRVAVIIEPAHPARLYPLLMSAYQLTPREEDVTRLTLHGSSTAQLHRICTSLRTPCNNTLKASSTRPASTAAATSSPKSSSTITNPECGTTNAASSATSSSEATPSPRLPHLFRRQHTTPYTRDQPSPQKPTGADRRRYHTLEILVNERLSLRRSPGGERHIPRRPATNARWPGSGAQGRTRTSSVILGSR